MRCPFCKHDDTKVTDSRATDDGRAIRRRRECQACNRRFTTYEMVEEVPLYVIKKDGSRQLFDRKKILTELRNIDAVAYIRFASVYRQFGDLDSFMEELKSLMGNEKN